MSFLLRRSLQATPLDFELEWGTYGLYQVVNGTPMLTGLCLGEQLVDPNSSFAAVEHWMLFTIYQPPHFVLGAPDVSLQLSPLRPSQINPAWIQYDLHCDVPAELFVSWVRANKPVGTYLKANVARMV